MCNIIDRLLGSCYCNTTDVCEECNINEGRVVGYGSHSDLPIYICYECEPEKEKKKGKTLVEQMNAVNEGTYG